MKLETNEDKSVPPVEKFENLQQMLSNTRKSYESIVKFNKGSMCRKRFRREKLEKIWRKMRLCGKNWSSKTKINKMKEVKKRPRRLSREKEKKKVLFEYDNFFDKMR